MIVYYTFIIHVSPKLTCIPTRLTLSHSGLRPSCDNVISCDKSPCITTNPATIDKCVIQEIQGTAQFA